MSFLFSLNFLISIFIVSARRPFPGSPSPGAELWTSDLSSSPAKFLNDGVRDAGSRRDSRQRWAFLQTASADDDKKCRITEAITNAASSNCGEIEAGKSCDDYTCNTGYEKDGTFTCSSEGVVEKRGSCARVYCTEVKAPENSASNFGCEKMESNTTCDEFTCNEGYQKTGSYKCALDGKSIELSGTCTRVVCANITAPTNSTNFKCTDVDSGESCSDYECETGFAKKGEFKCKSDGKSVESAGACERIACPTIELPEHADKDKSKQCLSLMSGEKCDFQCEVGWTNLIEEDTEGKSYTYECAADGKSYTSTGKCNQIMLKMTPPENTKEFPSELASGSKLSDFKCNTGWKPNGVFEVQADGSQLVSNGTCDRIYCENIKAPEHAASSFNCTKLGSNDTCPNFACEMGWQAAGSLKCALDGSKIESEAKCERIFCSDVPKPANAVDDFACGKIASGDTCELKCNVGWRPSIDDALFRCSKNGTYVDVAPTCLQNECPLVPAPANSTDWDEKTPILSGQSRNLTCEMGFAPRNKFTCNAEGDKIIERAHCERLYCASNTQPQNSTNFKCHRVASGEICDIECQIGFSVSGSYQCKKDASDYAMIPTCERKQISNIPAPQNATDFKCGTILSGMECPITCATGYSVNGVFRVDDRGDNLIQNATCNRKTCSGISAPMNSTNFTCGTINSAESCDISCIYGFDVVDRFICSDSGDEITKNATCKPSLWYHQVVRREEDLLRQITTMQNRTKDIEDRLSLFRAAIQAKNATQYPSKTVERYNEVVAEATEAIHRMNYNTYRMVNLTRVFNETSLNGTRDRKALLANLLNQSDALAAKLGQQKGDDVNVTEKYVQAEALWNSSHDNITSRLNDLYHLHHTYMTSDFAYFVNVSGAAREGVFYGGVVTGLANGIEQARKEEEARIAAEKAALAGNTNNASKQTSG